MNTPSPIVRHGDTTTFVVKVNGKPLDTTTQVVSIDTWVGVSRIPRARLVIFDGSAAEQDFPLSNSKTFLPGNKVDISAGYSGRVTPIFSGVIVKQGIEISQSESSRLVVHLADQAIKMTLERHNAIYQNITDSDLIGKLIDASGLAKKVTPTSVTHATIIQHDSTDWDLMVARAELHGFVVTVDAATVTVGLPDTQQSPTLLVQYGNSILDFKAERDAEMSKIRGHVRFQGSALAQTGKTIQLAGVGDRYNGSVYISGVHHEISNGQWFTTVDFGLAWPGFSAEGGSGGEVIGVKIS